MKKIYITPETDIIHYSPGQILAGSIDCIKSQGDALPNITRGEGDGGGDPSLFTNKGLWEEE